MNSFKLMITFFTRIPIKNVHYSEEQWVKGIKYTPFVGAIIGGILCLVGFLLHHLIHQDVLSLLMLLLYIGITGGLHLDGLSDTSDGIFSNRSKERILEIMKDSRIGAFGVISLILLLIGYFVMFTHGTILTLFLFPIVGRSVAIISCRYSGYAREEGMGKVFIEHAKKNDAFYLVLFTSLLLIVSLLYFKQWEIVISILLTYFISIRITKRISSKIDGITGDVIGFMIEVSQIIFLILSYAWGQFH